MKKTIVMASAIFSGMIFIFGCQSVPENIPDDLDARQLIQLGQDNYDAHHYLASQKYFNTVLERFGDDPKHYIEAKYELGHLFLKQKKYRAAYDIFNEILEIYESVPMGLPGSYKILCGIELAKIPEDKTEEFKRAAKPEPAAIEPERTRPEETISESPAPSAPTQAVEEKEESAPAPEQKEDNEKEAESKPAEEKTAEEKPAEKAAETPASAN